jgi:hypothetical protein
LLTDGLGAASDATTLGALIPALARLA